MEMACRVFQRGFHRVPPIEAHRALARTRIVMEAWAARLAVAAVLAGSSGFCRTRARPSGDELAFAHIVVLPRGGRLGNFRMAPCHHKGLQSRRTRCELRSPTRSRRNRRPPTSEAGTKS